MLTKLYLSAKNILRYRKPVEPDEKYAKLARKLKWQQNIDDIKRTITDLMLYNAGLMTVDYPENKIPSMVYLTSLQRNLKRTVE